MSAHPHFRTYLGDRRGMPYTGNDPQLMDDSEESYVKDEIFYSDGDGLKSRAGWYFKGQDGEPVGPFHTEYSAEEALIEFQLSEEEPYL